MPLSLTAKIREIFGKKTKKLREKKEIPAVLYGPKIKNIPLTVNLEEFNKVFREAGETTLVSLNIEDKAGSEKSSKEEKKKFLVLIHDVSYDPISGLPIHVDFYQPILTEEIEAPVPLVFVGESPAVKDLGGTLVKEIQEIEVKALPQNLPHEIKVDISKLKTFEDEILVKDLEIPSGVEVQREPDEIVAIITPPEKVEEELEKPAEEEAEALEKKEEREEKEKKEEQEEKEEQE